MEYSDQVVKVDITGIIKGDKVPQDNGAINGFMSAGSLSTFHTKKAKLATKKSNSAKTSKSSSLQSDQESVLSAHTLTNPKIKKH